MDIEELRGLLNTDEFKEILNSDEFKDLITGTKHVQGLVSNRDTILNESKSFKELLTAYKELGDVDTLKLAKEHYVKVEQERIAKEGEVKDSAVLAQLKSLQDKLASMELDKAQSLERTLSSAKDSFITKLIVDAKGEPELLSHIIGNRVKAEYKDDIIVFNILDKEGKDWAIDGKLASGDDLMKEIKSVEKYSRAFDSDVVTGTNARHSNNKRDNSPKMNPKVKDIFN